VDNADADADGNGDNPTMLAQSDATAEDSAPAYSPDGTNLAFQSDRGVSVPGPLSPRNLEIYRTDAAGVKRLTYSGPSANEDVGVINLTGFDLNPAWSPDGSRICFHSGRAQEYRDSNRPLIHGQWELYTLDYGNTGRDRVGGQPSSCMPDRKKLDVG